MNPVAAGIDTAPADPLLAGFADPPNEARPRVWWHWMNGNITQEGIRLDLEWMKRVGIGGVQNFDANLNTPQVVDSRLNFMTPEWRAALRYAASNADVLGLEMAIATSPGWSQTGGPWVRPEEAMKKLAWSETRVRGGEPFLGVLTKPPSTTGHFQDLPGQGGELEGQPELYVDARVIAYPLPAVDAAPQARPRITAGPVTVDGAKLLDGRLAEMVVLPHGQDGEAWVRYDFDRPQTIQAVSAAIAGGSGFGAPPPANARLEASNDGLTFRPVIELPRLQTVQRTASFAPVTARSFRLVLTPGIPPAPVRFSLPDVAPYPNVQSGEARYELSELTLHRGSRVHRFEEKAAFGTAPDYYAIPTPATAAGSAIPTQRVLDLTGRMRSDGTLDWTPPPGEWMVLRMGYSLTGETNGPASPEATGLEVDKLNAAHVKRYLDTYLGMYADAAGPELIGRRGLNALLSDSIESGPQNWTEDMIAQFARLRAYDPVPWLPALTGRVVESAEASDRFLYDFRLTIAELLATNHYGEVAAAARARGLTLYGEALEDNRPQLGNDLEMRKLVDVPMGAMWTFPADRAPDPTLVVDLRGAASVAHVYGQNLAAAESMTAGGYPWAHAPRDLKHVADLEFALGINRIVIHTSVHQPLTDGREPGLALAPQLGQYFNRNETWAEIAGPWVNYLARSSFMLQQGRYVADVAFFIGEEAPATALYASGPVPDAPTGYGYDFVSADSVRHVFGVEHGRLTTPGGMRYAVLYLGGSSRQGITLPTLRAIGRLVDRGAVVVGERPRGTPSQADDQVAWRTLADRLWHQAERLGGASHGDGRVIAGRTLDEALADIALVPDVAFAGTSAGGDLMTLHRALPDGDVYYVLNRTGTEETVEATFRVAGKAAEIWRAETGSSVPSSYRIEDDRTTVPLKLAPHDAIFVVFRSPAAQLLRTVYPPVEGRRRIIQGEWQVSFESGRGAPASIVVEEPRSLSESEEPGVRYFSGTSTYEKTIDITADWLSSGSRLELDLGEVGDLAEVSVNGRSLGVVWHPPFRVDASSALRLGANHIQVQVTNVWANRLIGDTQPGAPKIAFITAPAYLATATLRPSGLLGPVQLIEIVEQDH